MSSGGVRSSGGKHSPFRDQQPQISEEVNLGQHHSRKEDLDTETEDVPPRVRKLWWTPVRKLSLLELCRSLRMLDVEERLGLNSDYRELAYRLLGMSHADTKLMSFDTDGPTSNVISSWSKRVKNSTVGVLYNTLREMERYDAVEELEGFLENAEVVCSWSVKRRQLQPHRSISESELSRPTGSCCVRRVASSSYSLNAQRVRAHSVDTSPRTLFGDSHLRPRPSSQAVEHSCTCSLNEEPNGSGSDVIRESTLHDVIGGNSTDDVIHDVISGNSLSSGPRNHTESSEGARDRSSSLRNADPSVAGDTWTEDESVIERKADRDTNDSKQSADYNWRYSVDNNIRLLLILRQTLDQYLGIADPAERDIAMTHVRLQVYFLLLWTSLTGILDTIHSAVKSPYMGPIDSAPWSRVFYLLSLGKEGAFIAMALMSLLLMHTIVQYLLTHVLIAALLCLMIYENKTVSPHVQEMKHLYSEYFSQLHMRRLRLRDLRDPVAKRQRKIRRQLQLFLVAEAVLLSVCWYFSPSACSTLGCLHSLVFSVCVFEFVATLAVYLMHYKNNNPDLLHGRFTVGLPITKCLSATKLWCTDGPVVPDVTAPDVTTPDVTTD